MNTYKHADFPGNPRKNGIINLSDAPALPIKARTKKKSKPIPSVDQSFKSDAAYMALVNGCTALSAKELASVERTLQSLSVEINRYDAETLQIGAAITRFSAVN